MKKLLLALLFWPSLAFGQCNGVFPANTLCGNLTGSPAPPSAFAASGTVAGPVSSTLNGLPLWANTLGTLLKDGAGLTVAGNYTWSGNQVFNGTLSGTAWASPPALGASVPAAGAFTTLSATSALTFPNNSLTLAQFPTIATSTVIGYFGGGTGTPVASSVPSCANDGTHALVNNAGGGFSCVTISAAPTVQTFISGSSATYTPSVGTVRIRVRMCGGGGGGAAAATNNGSNGGTTSFGTWTAVLGQGGVVVANGGTGGTGGVNGTGTLIVRIPGQNGGAGNNNSGIAVAGGPGGSNPFSGGAPAVKGAGGVNAGLNATPNTGGGGGGGNNGGVGSAGGGAGEYVEFWVTNPGMITYTVGTGGSGGAAGNAAGGNGAAGIIIVEEFYL